MTTSPTSNERARLTDEQYFNALSLWLGAIAHHQVGKWPEMHFYTWRRYAGSETRYLHAQDNVESLPALRDLWQMRDGYEDSTGYSRSVQATARDQRSVLIDHKADGTLNFAIAHDAETLRTSILDVTDDPERVRRVGDYIIGLLENTAQRIGLKPFDDFAADEPERLPLSTDGYEKSYT